jgi:hypothetical protein
MIPVWLQDECTLAQVQTHSMLSLTPTLYHGRAEWPIMPLIRLTISLPQ